MLSVLQTIYTQTARRMPDLSSPYGMIPIDSDWFSFLPVEGWFFMGVLFFAALFMLYYFIQRFLSLLWIGKEDPTFMSRIKDYLTEGKPESAVKLCRNLRSASAKLIYKGIGFMGRPMAEIILILQEERKRITMELKRGIPLFAALTSAAPLFGLLGTVTLLAKVLPHSPVGGDTLLPLIGGLALGIFTLIAYFYLRIKVNRIQRHLDACLKEFLEILNNPVHP